ncbi:MAG: malto-oligosyltrehalose trehalohydrolase [Bryobacterales bacterium]|nr:malto-oligosyltrehalose trehalohydrolase [Bryobacterales bacterium]
MRTVGAVPWGEGGAYFRVWAPRRKTVELRLHGPVQARVQMTAVGDGYFEAIVERAPTGLRYSYVLDGECERPDPASRWQPDGVHAASAYVDPAFAWQAKDWRGLPLREYIIYELHVGAFTAEGTFDAAIQRIPYLLELGVTAVELMPVAAFPGERNWGYDGVYPFAVQHSYGGPDGLKRFVDACHLHGLAVVLDVVYNHLGPEGNYLRDFGPYFTQRYQTPWGEAINFDGADSFAVRQFFLQNALQWVTEFRVDALRLDASDTIHDLSARHFLEELATAIREQGERLNRRVYTIAETAANDSRYIRQAAQGGFGLDAQWNDDIHHALRRRIAGDVQGYFADYPTPALLAKGLREGFIYNGQYSQYRKRAHGNDARDLATQQFVVCCQNHDQVGNRLMGDRLGHTVPLPGLKLAAAFVLLSPYIPLLFMGEEYAEEAAFPYFVHHGDERLIAAVRAGRKREFAAFAWKGEAPDPQAEATYQSAKLHPEQRQGGMHRPLFHWYQQLISIRRTHPCLGPDSREGIQVEWDEATHSIWVRRDRDGHAVAMLFRFAECEAELAFPFAGGPWRCLLSSDEQQVGGELPERDARIAVGAWQVRLWERYCPTGEVARLREKDMEAK